jgi:hypothetical protein
MKKVVKTGSVMVLLLISGAICMPLSGLLGQEPGDTHCQTFSNRTCRTIIQELADGETVIHRIPGVIWHHVD